MSTISWFPAALGSLTPYEGDGKISFDTDGSILIDRIWSGPAYDTAYALCPKARDAAPAGTPGTNVFCINSSLERLKPDATIVRATYQGIWNMPFTLYQMDASRYERPIQYHPDFFNATKFPVNTKVYTTHEPTPPDTLTFPVFEKFRDAYDASVPADAAKVKFAGIEAYLVATACFRKTSYALSPDFGLANIFKLDAPETGGYSVPDSSNSNRSWLKGDKTCRNMYRGASQIWEVGECWLYNANGWLSEIYG